VGLKKDLTPVMQTLDKALSATDPKKAREGLSFAKLALAGALANHHKITVASSNKLFKKLMAHVKFVENMVKVDNGWLFDDKNPNQKAEIAKVLAHITPMHQDLLKAIKDLKKP